MENVNNKFIIFIQNSDVKEAETTIAAETMTQAPCPGNFNKTSQGCFYVDNTSLKNWNQAESTCQGFGSHVHLATIDTQQVILYSCFIYNKNVYFTVEYITLLCTMDNFDM